jgi:hypothetical protein
VPITAYEQPIVGCGVSKEENPMAKLRRFEIPGGTQEQYDAVIEEIDSDLLPGQVFHLAGPMEDGWWVLDV